MKDKTKKPVVVMNNWMLFSNFGHQYLTGYVKKHYRKELCHKTIHTSVVIKFDLEQGIAETLNTIYKLKTPWSLAYDRKCKTENTKAA